MAEVGHCRADNEITKIKLGSQFAKVQDAGRSGDGTRLWSSLSLKSSCCSVGKRYVGMVVEEDHVDAVSMKALIRFLMCCFY